jgi:cell division initiation protein
MIDLTPLDVRKKKGDFRKALRGYEAEAVDSFLDLVADRLEEVARENAGLRERNSQLGEAISSYRAREHAMNEALVTAQQLREEVREQAKREADLVLREARGEADRVLSEARRQLAAAAESTRRVHGQRLRYLRGLRSYVERQLAEIEAEEERIREAIQAEGREPHPEDPAQPER